MARTAWRRGQPENVGSELVTKSTVLSPPLFMFAQMAVGLTVVHFRRSRIVDVVLSIAVVLTAVRRLMTRADGILLADEPAQQATTRHGGDTRPGAALGR